MQKSLDDLIQSYHLPVDITTLPTIPLADRARLPKDAAIYFVLTADRTVMYIGHTQDLRTRWQSHGHLKHFLKREAMRIAWMPMSDPYDGRLIEGYLIHHFDPPCNITRLHDFERFYRVLAVRVKREEEALLEDFARQLADEACGFSYSIPQAMRIAALRYLRDSRFPK